MASLAVGSLTHRVLEPSAPSQGVPQFAAAKLGAVQFLPHTHFFLCRGLEVLVGVGWFQCDTLFILPKTRHWLPRSGGCSPRAPAPTGTAQLCCAITTPGEVGKRWGRRAGAQGSA